MPLPPVCLLRTFLAVIAFGLTTLSGSVIVSSVNAQTPPAPERPPAIVSPEVSADRHITFRLTAPNADTVRLIGGDIPGNGSGTALTKNGDGTWEVTFGPVDPGPYRYNFEVNGVPVCDPRSPSVSLANDNVWSLVYVPGSDFMDAGKVPHGAVASINYYSTSLGKMRRMHIYTPPGYEQGKGQYPVFYLLHGAGDSDDSWPSVGRAGFIMDNLIAQGKVKPMIVVMPAGHTPPNRSVNGTPRLPGMDGSQDPFVGDFVTDIMPYVEKNYRVINDRDHRAIAGLSMGGWQTLNIAVAHLNQFAYIGVFSSGLFGIVPRAGANSTTASPGSNFAWEDQHRAELDNAETKKGLKLLWFKTGQDDFLLGTTTATVALFRRHGFNPVSGQSPGGHAWSNWRVYLTEFAPQLFQ
jgi:enterochelin esterase-like enzyme